MCLYPKLIQNKKYTPTKKNGGNVPVPTDGRVLAVPIGCGNCIECCNQEARKWQIRLSEDVKEHKNGKFITLTLDTKHLKKYTRLANKKYGKSTGYDLDNNIAKIAVEKFRENYRKHYGKSIRHWLITELGHKGTEHLHLHGIIWTDKTREEITNRWGAGYIFPRTDKEWREAYANERTVNYIIKYVKKRDLDHQYYKPIILTSPGIGKRYIGTMAAKMNKYKGKDTRQEYITSTGRKISLPVYYRNHIYTDEEREKLWIQMLNKEERWIRGERVSIKNNNYDKYYKLLAYHRVINDELKFGGRQTDWERKEYENQRRTLLQKNRLKNVPNDASMTRKTTKIINEKKIKNENEIMWKWRNENVIE